MAAEQIHVSRGFSDNEREAVARIFWDGIGEKMTKIIGPRKRGIAVMAQIMEPDFVFLARLDGVPIGMAGIKRPDGAFGQLKAEPLREYFGRFGGGFRAFLARFDAAHSAPGILVLDALCVLEEARSLGAGAALMQECRKEAARHKLSKITIEVASQNKAARRFYAREGCREVSTKSMGMLGPLFGVSEMVALELAAAQLR